jgi:hypothetical protein
MYAADIKSLNRRVNKMTKQRLGTYHDTDERLARLGVRVTRLESLVFNVLFKNKGAKAYNELILQWAQPKRVIRQKREGR